MKLSKLMRLSGIAAAKSAGLKVKINVVALKGTNQDEIPELISWAHGEGFDLTLKAQMNTGVKVSDIVATVPADEQQTFVRREDMLNFLYLSLIFVGIYAIFVGIIVVLSLFAVQTGEVFETITATLEAPQN